MNTLCEVLDGRALILLCANKTTLQKGLSSGVRRTRVKLYVFEILVFKYVVQDQKCNQPLYFRLSTLKVYCLLSQLNSDRSKIK